MIKRALIITLLILFTIQPVLSEDLNTTDFKEPDVEVSINGDKEKPYLKDGQLLLDAVMEKDDSIKINYLLEPTNDAKADADNRKYTVESELKDVLIDASLSYRNGGGLSFQSKDGEDYLEVNVNDWDPDGVGGEEGGLQEINCTIEGVAPSPSARLEEIRAVSFDVQEASDDVLPPLILLVVDYDEFQKDLDSLDEQYDNLSSTLDQYAGKTDTDDLNTYLNRAQQNLSMGKSFYNDDEYIKANERMENTKTWLEKADKEAHKVEAEYVYQQADEKLDEVAGTLDKIDLYMEEVERKEALNTSTLLSYKSEYRGMQEEVSSCTEELAAAESYINHEKYSEAETKARNVLESAENMGSSANTLLEDLKSVITVEETPQSTATSESSSSESFEMPSINIDFRIVGIVMGVIVVAAVAGVGIRKYIRRRRWDELK